MKYINSAKKNIGYKRNTIITLYFFLIFNTINLVTVFMFLQLRRIDFMEPEGLLYIIFTEPFLIINSAMIFIINKFRKIDIVNIIFLPLITLLLALIYILYQNSMSCYINIIFRSVCSLLCIIYYYSYIRKKYFLDT